MEYAQQNIAYFGVVSKKCIHLPVQNIYTTHSNQHSNYCV